MAIPGTAICTHLHRTSLSAFFEGALLAPSGPDRYIGVFDGLYVDRVEDIDVKGATATAKLTTTQGDQLRTQNLSLVQEYGHWAIC